MEHLDSLDAPELSSPLPRETILETIADRSRRMIVTSTIERAKTAEEISSETDIPLSTCYRKITDLVEGKFLVVERVVMTRAGKKFALYRSTIQSVHVEIGPGDLVVSVRPNLPTLDKSRSAWLADILDGSRGTDT